MRMRCINSLLTFDIWCSCRCDDETCMAWDGHSCTSKTGDCACSQWKGCDKYFVRCISRRRLFHTALQSPSKVWRHSCLHHTIRGHQNYRYMTCEVICSLNCLSFTASYSGIMCSSDFQLRMALHLDLDKSVEIDILVLCRCVVSINYIIVSSGVGRL